MDAPTANAITRIGNAVRAVNDLFGEIDSLDTLINGAPNWAAEITDVNIATVGSFAAAGLTASQVMAALYVLKTQKALALSTDYPAWIMLANLR
jgi:uncharacterized membrane protein